MKAVDAQDVFDGEYNGDNPLAPKQKILRAMGQAYGTLGRNDNDAQKDEA